MGRVGVNMYPCPNPNICGVRSHRNIKNCKIQDISSVRSSLSPIPIPIPTSSRPSRRSEYVKYHDDGTISSKEYREPYDIDTLDAEDIEQVIREEYTTYGTLYQRSYSIVYTIPDTEQDVTEIVRVINFYGNGDPSDDEWFISDDDVINAVFQKPESIPIRRSWHPRKLQGREEWRDEKSRLHREDGPAVQEWYESGQLRSESWYLNGKLHRPNNECVQTKYFENGRVAEQFWAINDRQSRTDGGPTEIRWNEKGFMQYQRFDNERGRIHRVDGPAIVYWNYQGVQTNSEWYLEGTQYDSEDEWKDAVQPYLDARESGFTDEMSKAWAGIG